MPNTITNTGNDQTTDREVNTIKHIKTFFFCCQVRQLNSMGVEGIYAEDDGLDYAPSLIQPSIMSPGSVIYGGPPSYRSKPASPGLGQIFTLILGNFSSQF